MKKKQYIEYKLNDNGDHPLKKKNNMKICLLKQAFYQKQLEEGDFVRIMASDEMYMDCVITHISKEKVILKNIRNGFFYHYKSLNDPHKTIAFNFYLVEYFTTSLGAFIYMDGDIIKYNGEQFNNCDPLNVVSTTDKSTGLPDLPPSLKENILNGDIPTAVFLDGDSWKALPEMVNIKKVLNLILSYEKDFPIEKFIFEHLKEEFGE